jgi:glycosyltransferase involved in cell wall biosynthesis
MVTTYYPPYHFGGDAVFVQSLARALVQRGHSVEVVHCEDAYRLQRREVPAESAVDDGVTVHRLRSRLGPLSPMITQQLGGPGLKRAALERILGRKFDVVNFHNLSLVGGLGALEMSRAAVTLYTVHEHWLLCPTHIFWKNNRKACDSAECFTCCLRSGKPPQLWRYGNLRERALEHVDMLLAPSAFTARRHVEGGIRRPVRVLPTYSPLCPEQSSVGAVPEQGRFLYSGRLTPSKGVAELVRCLAKSPRFGLDVAGGGELLDGLRSEYRGCEWIRILGPIRHEEMGPLYAQATALVLPSRAPEVFPLTVLEALAHGTPVIVSDAGGSREAVEKSGAGFVYRNEEELEQALAALAEGRGVHEQMSRKARVAYETYYCEERYVREYLAIVDEIAAQKGSRLGEQ